MPIPLLGLASVLGREYANTLPTYKERDDFLKVVSPHTYYGNQLIQYLADKFSPDLGYDLKDIQARTDWEQIRPYVDSRPENQVDDATYNQQMADLSAQVNTPESMARFEDTLRNMDYGTIDPSFSRFMGPQELGSARDRVGEYNLPRDLGSLPVESNFTPVELEAIRSGMYGNAPETGPQQQEGRFEMPGPGGDFMPRGNDKNNFDVQQEYEQYLRGGLTGYRR
jgi:hypothetical protein